MGNKLNDDFKLAFNITTLTASDVLKKVKIFGATMDVSVRHQHDLIVYINGKRIGSIHLNSLDYTNHMRLVIIRYLSGKKRWNPTAAELSKWESEHRIYWTLAHSEVLRSRHLYHFILYNVEKE